MSTLFATFLDASLAQRAAGALLDHGVRNEDLTLVGNSSFEDQWYGRTPESTKPAEEEIASKEGISTTTGQDAAAGAAIGAGVGLGVGLIGALAAMIIPGFGIVVGGGTLAMALAAALGTVAGGAVAGGVTGFLVDQGMPEAVAVNYEKAVEHGGALLALQTPSGKLSSLEAEEILMKYNASHVWHSDQSQPDLRTLDEPSIITSREVIE